eukprot:5129809-Prymnesium_polylepis.1
MLSWLLLVALPAAHGWTSPQPHGPAAGHSLQPRARASALQMGATEPFDGSASGVVTGAEDIEKTDGIPNYMIRTSGTVARVAEGPDSSTEVQDDGVLYEPGRLVSIMTSDVIDMVQQQGGAAEKVDYLGENIL